MNLPAWILGLAATLPPLGLLWLLWRLALRPERCYSYNRALLLLAPLVAMGLPLLPHPALLTWLAPTGPGGGAAASVLLPVLAVGKASAGLAGGWAWAGLGVAYGLGVAVALGRLAWQVLRLRGLARRLPRLNYAEYALVRTGGRLPTSSFGRVVFWDETAYLTPAEARAVLAHELAHVRQGHSFDVLWLEVWRAVLWVNPFVHLLLPALRLTHELLADRAAATTTTEPTAYAALLARLAARQLVGPAYASLLHPFTFSATLTRIAMLQNQIPVRRWKQWLVLPVLGGLFLAACQSSPLETLAPPPPPPPPMLTTIDPKEIAQSPDGKVYTYVEQMPALPGAGGMGPIVSAIQHNLLRTTAKAGTMPEGRIFASFIVRADGTVHDVKLVKGLDPAYDEAVLEAIRQLPRFVPGKQSGKAVAVSFTVPIQLKPQ